MEYILYKNVLKKYKNFMSKENIGKIVVGKHRKSYLIGPIINNLNDLELLYRRVKSNCIYEISSYKNLNSLKARKLIKQYGCQLNKNEIIEINRSKIKIHKIIPIPGDKYEE